MMQNHPTRNLEFEMDPRATKDTLERIGAPDVICNVPDSRITHQSSPAEPVVSRLTNVGCISIFAAEERKVRM